MRTARCLVMIVVVVMISAYWQGPLLVESSDEMYGVVPPKPPAIHGCLPFMDGRVLMDPSIHLVAGFYHQWRLPCMDSDAIYR